MPQIHSFGADDLDPKMMDKEVIKGPTRFERLRFRVDDLIRLRNELEGGKCQDFINTLERHQRNNTIDTLSQAQEKWIYGLWSELHNAGIAQLPKGMV